jgi:hypothetical protein
LKEIPYPSEGDNGLWVGAEVWPGDELGSIGKFNDRHLHIEIRSFGSAFPNDALAPRNDDDCAPGGCVNSAGIIRENVPKKGEAPNVYDITQFFVNEPAHVEDPLNGNLVIEGLGSASVIVRDYTDGEALCTLEYRLPDPNNLPIVKGTVYRGFVLKDRLEDPKNPAISPFE